jgi:hypothetical protein
LPFGQAAFALALVMTRSSLGGLTNSALPFSRLPPPQQLLALGLAAELLVPSPRCEMIVTTTAQANTPTSLSIFRAGQR